MAFAPKSMSRTRSIALQAFTRMQELGVPPTPENYATWFAYYSGSNPELSAEVDRLDLSGMLTAENTARLHDDFLGMAQERRGLQDISMKIEEAMRSLIEQVNQVERGAQDYGNALNSLSGDLSTHDTDSVSTLIAMVIGETERMALMNRDLEERLAQSASEISRLRTDLQTVRVEATTDGLTGLANRKAFDQDIQTQIEDAVRQGYSLSLLILDIDHFKTFNDTHGHQTGDQVLRLVARTVQSVLPPHCTAARLGGEEFCVLTPRFSLGQACQIGESIRKAVGSKVLKNRKTGEALGLVTLSVGVATHVFGETSSQLIERADEALYLAKHTGRNRVCSQTDLHLSALQAEA